MRSAVGVVVALFAGAGVVLPLHLVKVVIAATLVTLGIYRLWRHRHPRFGGMQVGFRDLTIWSFLMASAHGAGLMVVPVRDRHRRFRLRAVDGMRSTRITR